MAVYNGFAPNWYYNPGDAGLAIYVSSGSVNGHLYNGQIVIIPAQLTVDVWVNPDGSFGVGAVVPNDAYAAELLFSDL